MISPLAYELLGYVARMPVPIGRCDKYLRRQLVDAGFVTVEAVEWTEQGDTPRHSLRVVVIITDAGRKANVEHQQEITK